MVKKILCIDDIPECEIGNTTLKKCLATMFKGKFEVIFEKRPEKAYEIIRKDADIKLIFLDVDFAGDPLGPEIADNIKSIDPELRVIVLTTIDSHGAKVRFGKKPNVAKYVTKQELEKDIIKTRVTNLANGLIEDPDNKNWIMEFDDARETITMETPANGFKKIFNLPSKSKRKAIFLLYACTERPNVCLQSIDMRGFVDNPNDNYAKYINEVVYEVNKTVREATEWRTWGVLDSLSCGKSAVKLVIGKIRDQTNDSDDVSSNSKGFDELKVEIEDLKKRINQIEEYIKKNTHD